MMGRLIRQLTGPGRRDPKADEIMRRHLAHFVPGEGVIKAGVAAIERLVLQLKKDHGYRRGPRWPPDWCQRRGSARRDRGRDRR